jgi:hypothetical protein
MTSNASSYVAYKTIIGHYNTVLKLLGLVPYKGSLDALYPSRTTSRRASPISFDETPGLPSESLWPDVTLAQSMSGGVGLFGVYGLGKQRVPANIVTEIPTVIHVLEPNLSVEDFRRLKRDAGFQNKTTRMCEGCFLVYAQVGFTVCRVRFFDVLVLSVRWRDRLQWQ